MNGILIKSSGEMSYVELKDDDAVRDAIGGYFRIAPVPGNKHNCLVVDEDAMMVGKPVNKIASSIYQDVLLGDVLLMGYNPSSRGFKSLV